MERPMPVSKNMKGGTIYEEEEEEVLTEENEEEEVEEEQEEEEEELEEEVEEEEELEEVEEVAFSAAASAAITAITNGSHNNKTKTKKQQQPSKKKSPQTKQSKSSSQQQPQKQQSNNFMTVNELNQLFRYTALCIVIPIWFFLVAFIYSMNSTTSLLQGIESLVPASSACIFAISIVSSMIPLLVKRNTSTSSSSSGGVVSGILISLFVLQTIAVVTNLLLAFFPVVVVRDSVTFGRVFLIRSCEWIPFCILMTIITESIDFQTMNMNNNGAGAGTAGTVIKPFAIGLGRIISCICSAFILPFCPNFISWLLVLGLSVTSFYITTIVRLNEKYHTVVQVQQQLEDETMKLMEESTNNNATTKKKKKSISSSSSSSTSVVDQLEQEYDRVKAGYDLLWICTMFWSTVMIVYGMNGIAMKLLRQHDQQCDDDDSYYDWIESLGMVLDTIVDVIAKCFVMKILLDIHDTVFDVSGGNRNKTKSKNYFIGSSHPYTRKQLSELQKLMSALWENSSDVIIISMKDSSDTDTDSDSSTTTTDHVTTMLSPTFSAMVGKAALSELVADTAGGTTSSSTISSPLAVMVDGDWDESEHQLLNLQVHFVEPNSTPFPVDDSSPSSKKKKKKTTRQGQDDEDVEDEEQELMIRSIILKEAERLAIVLCQTTLTTDTTTTLLEHDVIVTQKDYDNENEDEEEEKENGVIKCELKLTQPEAHHHNHYFANDDSNTNTNTNHSSFNSGLMWGGIGIGIGSSSGLGRKSLPMNTTTTANTTTTTTTTTTIAIVRDVTERHRRFEAERRAHEETLARQKDAQTMNRFTRHEIKNGLMAGIEFCSSMRNTIEDLKALSSSTSSMVGSGGEAQHHYKSDLARYVTELDGTLHDILDTMLADAMARDVVHNVYEPKREQVDAKQLVCNTTRRMHDSGAETGRFTVKVDPPNMPLLSLDPLLLQYIHRNAVSNACRYGAKNGPIKTDVRYFPNSNEFELDVVNSPGIHHDKLLELDPTAIKASVFAQGTRLDNAAGHNNDGVSTGDGAWIMQCCAQALGGTCSLKFEPTKTIFSFRCPAKATSPNSWRADQTFTVPPGTWGVAVDDSVVQRRALTRILTQLGVATSKKVVCGKTPEECEFVAQQIFDILEQNPNDYILCLVDENLDYSDSHGMGVSGSKFMSVVLSRLKPDQEARVLALIRPANDSADDIVLYRERAHGFFPKSTTRMESTREILAPLWRERFHNQAFEETIWAGDDNELSLPSSVHEEELITREDLIDSLGRVQNFLANNKNPSWPALWSKLHYLKGDLMVAEDNDPALVAEGLINNMRGGDNGDTPENFASIWELIQAQIQQAAEKLSSVTPKLPQREIRW